MAKGRTWQKQRVALGKAGVTRKHSEGVLKGRTLVVDDRAYHIETLGHGLYGDRDGRVFMRETGEVWQRVGERVLSVAAGRWYVMGGERRGFEFSGIRGA